jgi:hypothetical protein
VAVGSNATFVVVAQNALAYQWYETPLGATNVLLLTNQTSSVLNFTNAQTNLDGNYFVQVTNNLGSITSSIASLTVETAPIIIDQPTNETATVGSNVTFGVTASGGGLAYQWLFNGTSVASNSIPGGTAQSLTLTNVQTTNAGTYWVIITNLAGGVLSSNATLTIAPVSAGEVAAERRADVPYLAALPGSAQATVFITSASVASNTITLVYPGLANHTYIVQFKATIDAPEWTSLATNMPAADGACTCQDATTNGSSRFYRILVQ